MLSLSNRRLAKQVIVVAVLVAAPLAITAPVLNPDPPSVIRGVGVA